MFSILTSVDPEMYIPWVLLSLICRLSLDKSRRSLGYEEKRIDPIQTKYSPERNHKKLFYPVLTSLFPNISPPEKW